LQLRRCKFSAAKKFFPTFQGVEPVTPPPLNTALITQLLTCKEHHACLYLVSVHQMAPPLNVVANI